MCKCLLCHNLQVPAVQVRGSCEVLVVKQCWACDTQEAAGIRRGMSKPGNAAQHQDGVAGTDWHTTLPHLCKISKGVLCCCCCCCCCCCPHCIRGMFWEQCVGAGFAGLIQLIAPVAVPVINTHTLDEHSS
jgi:hypothetical protein